MGEATTFGQIYHALEQRIAAPAVDARAEETNYPEMAQALVQRALDDLKRAPSVDDLVMMEKTLRLVRTKLGPGKSELRRTIKAALTSIGSVKKEAKVKAKDAWAAEKLLAAVKRNRVRNRVVLPKQITPVLERYMPSLGKHDVAGIAKVLTREIAEMTLHPEKYKGKRVYIPPMTRKHLFPVDTSLGNFTETLVMGDPMWLHLTPDGKSIEVLLVVSSEKHTRAGSYKQVKVAHKFAIPLRLSKEQGSRRVMYAPRVTARMVEDNTEEHHDAVKKGWETQRRLVELSKNTGRGKFVGLPTKIEEDFPADKPRPIKFFGKRVVLLEDLRAMTGKVPMEAGAPIIEYEQEWCNGSYEDMLTTGTIPLDIVGKANRRPILSEKLNALVDVAESLEVMHERGLVHRDIKPGNILLKTNAEGGIDGLVSDFDLSQPVGTSDVMGDYPFWDPASEAGFVTTYTDYYGLFLSVAMTILPDFDSYIEDSETLFPEDKNEREQAQRDALAKMATTIVVQFLERGGLSAEIYQFASALKEKHMAPDAIKERLNVFLQDETLAPETKALLTKVITNVDVAQSTFESAIDTIEHGRDIQTFINTRPILQAALAKLPEELTDPAQIAVYDQLRRHIPPITALRDEIIDLRDALRRVGA